MPEYLKVTTGGARLALWRIGESESELKAYIGGDSFPVLGQFQDSKRRLEWLGARCALKMLGVTEPVMYEPNRRPYLLSGARNISISHSFPFVAVVSSPYFDVGLDIESLARPFSRIVGKFLTFGEHSWIDLEDNLQLALVWSAKEAFFKLRVPKSFNSFTDVAILPMGGELSDRGVLKSRIDLRGLALQTVCFEYRVIEEYVLTWVSCHPDLLPHDSSDVPA